MNENDRSDIKNGSPRKKDAAPPAILLTIGHSNRSIEEFIDLLQAHSVERHFDIRTIPRSRHNPQFNSDALRDSLRQAGIEYVHVPELGGLRHASNGSINTAWKNASFRGYADYMQTPEFDAALTRLIDAASEKRSVFMCAEAVPWRCHRSLVADALTARGIAVEHIMSRTKRDPHSMTAFATVQGARVTYPAKGESGTLPFA